MRSLGLRRHVGSGAGMGWNMYMYMYMYGTCERYSDGWIMLARMREKSHTHISAGELSYSVVWLWEYNE